jgi:serine/threonine-protein kinase
VQVVEPGTRIDRYVLEEPLGSGGFSTVYRAHHSLIGNKVAFKLLKAEHTRNSVTTERFLREAQFAASIGNPHIVKVMDCGTAPTGEMFLVMELLEGQSLADVIEAEAPLPAARAVALVQQVLDGLSAAHAAGIVHRDVKPDNIFLTKGPEGRPDFVKILDFGVSKILDSNVNALTTAGEVLGTPLYMAPEQIMGSDRVDHRVDVYATAAVLFHALAGRPPHDAQSIPQLAHMILTAEPPPLSAVVPGAAAGLEEAVRTGLARDPSARWQTARSFADALAPFTPSSPTAPGFLASPATSPQGRAAAATGSQPSYGAPASYGSQPSYGAPASYGSQPAFSSPAPAYGSQPSAWGAAAADVSTSAPWPPLGDSQPSASGLGVPSTSSGGAPAPAPRGGLPLWALFLIVGLAATVLGGATVAIVAFAMAVTDGGESRSATPNPPLPSPTPPSPVPPSPYPPAMPPSPYPPPATPGPYAGPNVLGPASAGGEVRLGQPLMGVLPMGQRVDYPLQLDQRGMITITLQSDQFDTFLYLVRNGVELGRDDDGGGGFNSRISLWLEPGTYAVRVASFGDQGGGPFVLSAVRTL